MAELNLAALEAVAKEIVEPRVHQLVNTTAILLSEVFGENDGENVAETNLRGVRIAIQTQVNAGLGYGEEMGILPEAGAPVYRDMRVFFSRVFLGGRFTGDALEQMSKSNQMLIDGVAERFAQDAEVIKKEVNQSLYQNGNGRKAIVETVTATGAGGRLKFALPHGIHQILKGGKYALVNPTTEAYRLNGGSAQAPLRATSRSGGTAREFTFDNVPSDAVAGDELVWYNSWKKGIHGLKYHVNNANTEYQGLDKTLNDELKSTIVDGSAGLTYAVFDMLEAQLLYVKGGDYETNGYVYLCSPTQSTQYVRLGDGMRRWNDKIATLDFGVAKTEIKGKRMLVDPDCPDDTFYLLNKKYLRKYQFKPLDLWKVQGKYFHPVLASTSGTTDISYRDGLQYWHEWKFDAGGWMPNAQAAITGLPVGASMPSAGKIFSSTAI